jgi:UDP-N-acetylmuramate--alanine ligase
MYAKIQKIHLVGIGGIGMSGIARLLARHGYRVSGSDLSMNEGVRALNHLGMTIAIGHKPENVEGADLVVLSSAISPENPEVLVAQRLGILTISRAEMLAELMRFKYSIAVAGAHGKTTTTSLIGLILREGLLDPTIVVGGRMDNFGGTNACLGDGDFMVVEADESDGTFSRLSPSIAVVTNIDREHMDFHKTMRRLKSSFTSFLNKVPFYGLSIFCGDDPHLQLLQHRVVRRKLSYGFSERNHYRISNYAPLEGGSQFEIQIGDQVLKLELSTPGKHNALNATAALIVADELSVSRETTLAALKKFQGVQRRFQKRGTKDGVLFVDDYAHHPQEIAATLQAAREQFPRAHIRALFQPHRYSRFEDLFEEFSQCFSDCDTVGITDIYAAGEAPIAGVRSDLLVENMQKQGFASSKHVKNPTECIEGWLKESREGDVILTLGAGDLSQVYRTLFS